MTDMVWVNHAEERGAENITQIGDDLSEGCQQLPPPSLMLTLACGEDQTNVETNPSKTTEGSPHAGEKEGGSENA